MNNKLEQMLLEQQLDFLKNLETLLSGFTHDINNNLAVMAGQSSILKTLVEMNKITEEKTLKSSEKILSASDKMSAKIELLRSFYKPSTTKNDKINISMAISTMFLLSRAKIDRNELNVSENITQFEPNDAQYAKGNPTMFNILLWNIHYLCLDLLEQNKTASLKIESTQTGNNLLISYKLKDLELNDSILETPQVILSKSVADKLECELNADVKNKTFLIKIPIV